MLDWAEYTKFFLALLVIVNPIGRRDRKSGAKKRKQHEIEALRHVVRGEFTIVGN